MLNIPQNNHGYMNNENSFKSSNFITSSNYQKDILAPMTGKFNTQKQQPYTEIKQHMNNYIKKCYQNELEKQETFQNQKITERYTMMHHRPNNSVEVRGQIQNTNMFIPSEAKSKQRNESKEYEKRYQNQKGEIQLQSKQRIIPEKSKEIESQLKSRRIIEGQGASDSYRRMNLMKGTTFGERQVLNKNNKFPAPSQISQVFGEPRTSYVRAMGIDDFTAGKNYLSLQETKKVTANYYIRDNPKNNLRYNQQQQQKYLNQNMQANKNNLLCKSQGK